MKKTIYLIFTLISISNSLFSQDPIDVTEQTIKIGGMKDEQIYLGFAEGDKIIFNFKEIDNKEIKEIEILEYPSFSKFSDFKTKKIENKILNVSKQSVYIFRFKNSSISGRICNIKIQRIPSNELTKNFNTSVFWKTVYDTTYIPTQERFILKSDTIAREIYASNPQISSQNALNGNKNYQIVDFVLPENTISWSFYIGTGKKGKEEYENAKDNFNKSTASYMSSMPGYGPMAALALSGISFFNKAQGEDNVKYWFLSDVNSVYNFENNASFMQYKKGDVINEASQMTSPKKGKVYLALLNDNTVDVISVTLRVTVVQVNNIWDTRIINVMKVNQRVEPYFKN